METDAEMTPYLIKNFANTAACDEIIKEWENDCAKEEEKSLKIINKKRQISSSIT